MELTLKRLLEQAEFTDARKGYDRDQVDEFLDRAVAMATKVEAKLTETLEQAKANNGPAQAGPNPAQIEAEVERRVAARLAEAPAAATGQSEDDMAEEVRRTIVLAQRTADAAVREAREDAAKLLADANERAASLNAEIDARASAARAELSAQAEAERAAARERLGREIAELEGIREALRSDVTVLERHVEEQRSQLRSTVGELQRLLDDPAGFRLAPTPALLDPEIPDLGIGRAPQPTAGDAPEQAGPDQPDPEPQPAAEAPRADADQGADPTPEPAPEPEQAQRSTPESPAVAQTAVAIDDGPGAGPATLSFGDVDHAAPGLGDPGDAGPPTAPVSAVDLGMAPGAPAPAQPSSGGDDEDAFLSELRKAM
ncbi:MAG TPA: DivIVA domain-containing protein, partial [Aquihabitans sp.]|nr:DivIVA domain-containing protein [Aquihabitans sp.]